MAKLTNKQKIEIYERRLKGETLSSLALKFKNRYPFGTVLKVTNRDNGKSVKVVVTDTGSFSKKYGRDLDLSRGAFQKIASLKTGIISADIKVVNQKHIFKYKKGAPHFTNQDYRRFLR